MRGRQLAAQIHGDLTSIDNGSASSGRFELVRLEAQSLSRFGLDLCGVGFTAPDCRRVAVKTRQHLVGEFSGDRALAKRCERDDADQGTLERPDVGGHSLGHMCDDSVGMSTSLRAMSFRKMASRVL